jgi:hypothetical protein
MADVTDVNNQTTGGRGNLSFTSINLPRIAIKHGICLKDREKADMKGFYKELSDTMELVRDQLYERFEIQCNSILSKRKQFPVRCKLPDFPLRNIVLTHLILTIYGKFKQNIVNR